MIFETDYRWCFVNSMLFTYSNTDNFDTLRKWVSPPTGYSQIARCRSARRERQQRNTLGFATVHSDQVFISLHENLCYSLMPTLLSFWFFNSSIAMLMTLRWERSDHVYTGIALCGRPTGECSHHSLIAEGLLQYPESMWFFRDSYKQLYLFLLWSFMV